MLLRSSSSPILSSFASAPLEPPRPPSSSQDLDLDPHLFYSYSSLLPSPASASLPPPRLSHDPHLAPSADDGLKLNRDFEKNLASLPGGLRRAQSEGDLASLSNGVACRFAACSLMGSVADEKEIGSVQASSLHRQWTRRVGRGAPLDRKYSILEESELFDLDSEYDGGDVALIETPPSVVQAESVEENHQMASADRGFPPIEPSVSVSGRNLEGFLMDDGEFYSSVNTDANGVLLVCNSKGCRPMTESERLRPMYMASGLGLGIGGGSRGGSGSSGHGGSLGGDANGAEANYQRLLRDDPQNPLLLRNYAQYLSEVNHDFKKSEEYYERAILACPSDGDVLSQYAKHVWDVHKDHDRAEIYYDRAVKAAPEDSYVLASYASFLWDAEDDEETDPSSLPVLPAIHGASLPLVASA